ncbi:MAG TPA: hypothetical protein VM096_01675 [Vicinamibacterales bacterium]|nr:hypothetical protein [Vicinamibacterales bacterium]
MSSELFAAVFVLGMFSGVFIIYMGLRQRSQQLEMLHRERMAMIERGQIPLSEPHDYDRHANAHGGAPSSRSLSVGIIIVGLGLAIMTIISVAAASPEVGIGVGGAIAILGGAFIARSLVVRPEIQGRRSTALTPPPSTNDRI